MRRVGAGDARLHVAARFSRSAECVRRCRNLLLVLNRAGLRPSQAGTWLTDRVNSRQYYISEPKREVSTPQRDLLSVPTRRSRAHERKHVSQQAADTDTRARLWATQRKYQSTSDSGTSGV